GSRPGAAPQLGDSPRDNLRKQLEDKRKDGQAGARRGPPPKIDREQMVAMRRAVQARRIHLQQERTHHIRRMAQIARIRELGEEKEQTQLVEKANMLEEKEKQRHERKMQVLHKQELVDPKIEDKAKTNEN
ncbi:MAG: hypothetical protein ACNA8W_09790, partial [Bradymonadaceae bacterium]